jgi:dihydrofolate reductase
MRKLKLQVQITADGFIAGTNGELDWLNFNWDQEMKSYVSQLTESIDCIILGRKLAQGFIPHWASRPDYEPDWFIDKMNNSPKLVFTKTLTESPWPNTRLATGDLVKEVNNLKEENGKDIIVYGGGQFVASLIKARLIDEFHLFVNPVILKEGMPIFNTVEERQPLVLKKSIPFTCGISLLNYELPN